MAGQLDEWSRLRALDRVIQVRYLFDDFTLSIFSFELGGDQMTSERTSRKKLSSAPAWLDISADRLSFVFDIKKADIVRVIFDETASGIGSYVIARRFNETRMPVLGPSKLWLPSSIYRILQNRAVLGEYQAKSRKGGFKTPVPVGEPVLDYYPRVVSDEIFVKAQAALQQNLTTGKGRKGTCFTNLFTGILFCECGARMNFFNHDKQQSFACAQNFICEPARWNYANFEVEFLEALSGSIENGGLEIAEVFNVWLSLYDFDVYHRRNHFNHYLKSVYSKVIVKPVSKKEKANEAFSRICSDQASGLLILSGFSTAAKRCC